MRCCRWHGRFIDATLGPNVNSRLTRLPCPSGNRNVSEKPSSPRNHRQATDTTLPGPSSGSPLALQRITSADRSPPCFRTTATSRPREGGGKKSPREGNGGIFETATSSRQSARLSLILAMCTCNWVKSPTTVGVAVTPVIAAAARAIPLGTTTRRERWLCVQVRLRLQLSVVETGSPVLPCRISAECC